MDRFLTATEARQQFLKLLAEVQEGERIIITHRGKPTAAIIDFERLQLLTELGRLWQDPEALAYIRTAHDEVKAGRTFHLQTPATVKRLAALARKRGLVKSRGG